MSYMTVIHLLRFLHKIGFIRLNFDDPEDISMLEITGPAIILPKHQSWWDIPIIALIAGIIAKRQLEFLAKKELFETKLGGWQMRKWSAIPVDRGGIDRTALKVCTSRLAESKVLCVFPEGTRIKDKVGEIKDGPAFIAHLSKIQPRLIAVSFQYRSRFPLLVDVRCQDVPYGQDHRATTKNLSQVLNALWDEKT